MTIEVVPAQELNRKFDTMPGEQEVKDTKTVFTAKASEQKANNKRETIKRTQRLRDTKLPVKIRVAEGTIINSCTKPETLIRNENTNKIL